MCSNGSAHTRARRAAQPRPPRNNSAARTLGRSRSEFVPLGRRVYTVRRQRNRFLAAVTFGCLRTTSAIVGEAAMEDEALIVCVQDYPNIYDLSHPKYHDKM
ncbi:hypothetical protein J6590_064993 [Homalodisca vitripennis]|nr:hypothetical protein J6590_064993 [Homalodisca vitripennis]